MDLLVLETKKFIMPMRCLCVSEHSLTHKKLIPNSFEAACLFPVSAMPERDRLRAGKEPSLEEKSISIMGNQTRRQQIVDAVNRSQQASVEGLAEHFHVSVETIRRDLSWLEKTGRLIRVHGGARTLQRDDVGDLFEKRRNEHIEAKNVMAHKALSMIERYMTIGLDASSSDWFLARLLPDMPLTVVTNSLEIVKELDSRPSIRIVCTGGDYCSRYADFIGTMAQRNLQSQHIHISFVSCFGVNIHTGLWENSEINAMTKRAMIDVSQKTVLLADSGKYGRRSLYNMVDWSKVRYVVNDGMMDNKTLTRFGELGITVI